MTSFSPNASDNAKQVNFAGDNLAPIVMGPAVTPATRQLPPDIADFTGRDKELRALAELIDQHRGPAPVIIGLYGPPGVGKSVLALRLAHCLADRHEMQLYLNVGPSMVPRDALVHFVSTLTVLDPADPYPESALRAHYLSTLRTQNCLVLLDDVHSAGQARALIPASPLSTVLITSRAPLSGIEGVHLRPVSVPGEIESIQLLQKASGRTTTLDMASAREVVAACGRLPLAVRIAGALLKKRPHLGVAGLAAKLRDERTRLQALTDGDLDVRASLSLSYKALSPTARQAFRLSALSPNPEVTLADLSVLLDAPATATADELVDAQLLETTDGETLRVHALVKLYAAERCHQEDTTAEADAAAERLLAALTEEFLRRYREVVGGSAWWRLEQITDWGRPAALPTREPYVERSLTPRGRSGPAVTWEMVLRSRRTVVVGGPGSGKTTLAQRICSEIARENSDRLAFAVPLRYFQDDDIDQLIVGAVRHRLSLRCSVQVLRRVLGSARCTVIFDSIDELPPQQRSACAAAIRAYCDQHPQLDAIVTSRPEGLALGEMLPGFKTYELGDLSAAAARQLVQILLDDPTGRPASDLLTAIASTPARALARSPLMLSWLVATFREHRRLPVTELELHNAIYSVTVGSRERRRQISRSDMTPREVAQVAEFVAYWLKASPDRTIGVPRDDLLAACQRDDELKSRLGGYEPSLLAGLEQLIEQGLLYEAGVGDTGTPVLSIVQDTFGEYLAARWLISTVPDNSMFLTEVGRLMAAGRFESGWRYAIEMHVRNDDQQERRGPVWQRLRAAAATLNSDTQDQIVRYLDTLAQRKY